MPPWGFWEILEGLVLVFYKSEGLILILSFLKVVDKKFNEILKRAQQKSRKGVKKVLEILKNMWSLSLKVRESKNLKFTKIFEKWSRDLDKKCPKIFRKCYQENKMCAWKMCDLDLQKESSRSKTATEIVESTILIKKGSRPRPKRASILIMKNHTSKKSLKNHYFITTPPYIF